jgi:hypothetical protein
MTDLLHLQAVRTRLRFARQTLNVYFTPDGSAEQVMVLDDLLAHIGELEAKVDTKIAAVTTQLQLDGISEQDKIRKAQLRAIEAAKGNVKPLPSFLAEPEDQLPSWADTAAPYREGLSGL